MSFLIVIVVYNNSSRDVKVDSSGKVIWVHMVELVSQTQTMFHKITRPLV